MSRVSPVQTNFNAGEISPLMLGRFDHDIWSSALLECVGWMPRPQGPLEACPGTERIAPAAGPCVLWTLEPYVDQAYIIEASALKFRFYSNDARLETAPGVPLELAHPYSYVQLREADIEPSEDVLYIWHGDVAPKMLVRTGAEAFTLEDYEPLNGPFEDRNQDKTLTVTASATSGTVTLTSSAALFEAGDVGGLFEIEFTDLSTVKVWEPGMTVAINDLCQWGNNVYKAISALGSPARTGSFAPIHTDGTEYDGLGGTDINSKGPYGVAWEYLHNAYGQLKITGFTNATTVTAEVQKDLASTSPQWRWRFGAFSDRRGWPEKGVIYQERMVLAKGDRRYISQVGLLNDFSRFNEFGDIGDDQAMTAPLNNPNRITWLHSSTELFTGTSKNESTLRQASAAKGFAPGNVRSTIASSKGSSTVRPADMDGQPIFVQRAGGKMILLKPSDYDRYVPDDLTRYADHIGASPIRELAWQNEPLQLLWGVRDDGLLFGAIMMPAEEVLGYFRRPLASGYLARSITSCTSPDTRRDDLWIAAQEGSKWHVLKLAPIRRAAEIDGNAIMLDAAVRVAGPVSTVTVAHLANKTVDMVLDGNWRKAVSVPSSGIIDLGGTFDDVTIGLPFPAYFITLPREAGGDLGPGQFKAGRTGRVYGRVQGSLGLQIIVDEAPNSAVKLETQQGNSPMDVALPFMTTDFVRDVIGTWSRLNTVRVDRLAPFQSTMLALGVIVQKAQR